jgi:hypothetical protein
MCAGLARPAHEIEGHRMVVGRKSVELEPEIVGRDGRRLLQRRRRHRALHVGDSAFAGGFGQQPCRAGPDRPVHTDRADRQRRGELPPEQRRLAAGRGDVDAVARHDLDAFSASALRRRDSSSPVAPCR